MWKPLAVVATAAVAGVLVAAAASGPALAASGDSKAPVYYLSLGDSLAAGEQPTLPPGQNFGDEGYADQLYASEHAKIPNLQLVKLGCGGESTVSIGVRCHRKKVSCMTSSASWTEPSMR